MDGGGNKIEFKKLFIIIVNIVTKRFFEVLKYFKDHLKMLVVDSSLKLDQILVQDYHVLNYMVENFDRKNIMMILWEISH